MLIGKASADITPPAGVELMGFAMREQPSTGVLDPLMARALYLEEGGSRVFLVNVDLVGLSTSTVQRIRKRIGEKIPGPAEVMIFATHTHSGPGTAPLAGCGAFNPDYIRALEDSLVRICREAGRHPVACRMEYGVTTCELAVNRRGGDVPDARMGVVRWMTGDTEVFAMLVTYAMHPVSLKSTLISADYPGEMARQLSASTPGHPLVLFGLLPSGDINTPEVGVEPEKMAEWGRKLADAAVSCELSGVSCKLSVAGSRVRVPVTEWTEQRVNERADRYLKVDEWHEEFGTNYRVAVETWRHSRLQEVKSGGVERYIELSLVNLGSVRLVFVNAEVFSKFSRLIRESEKDRPGTTLVITCANGQEGYIPDEEAWESGGYEIETAAFFYNLAPPVKGFLEELAGVAKRLL